MVGLFRRMRYNIHMLTGRLGKNTQGWILLERERGSYGFQKRKRCADCAPEWGNT